MQVLSVIRGMYAQINLPTAERSCGSASNPFSFSFQKT